MSQSWKQNHAVYLIVVGLAAWLVPGGGHFLLNERRRAAVIFVAVVLTFLIGLYVGSVGVIDPVGAKPWYAAQIMNTPAVAFLGTQVAQAQDRARQESDPDLAYPVYGRAAEVGQIYTSIAGLLNLLCIVNAIYVAHQRSEEGANG
jgi:hypothetical protein